MNSKTNDWDICEYIQYSFVLLHVLNLLLFDVDLFKGRIYHCFLPGVSNPVSHCFRAKTKNTHSIMTMTLWLKQTILFIILCDWPSFV